MDIIGLIVLVSSGVSSLVLLLGRTWLVEKVKSAIKSEYDLKLENFKAEISRNQSILSGVITAQSNLYNNSSPERITAIKRLWENFLKAKYILDPINIFDSSITRDELTTLYTTRWQGNDIVERTIQNFISDENVHRLSDLRKETEVVVPFISSDCWTAFFIYITFVGRVHYIYRTGNAIRKMTHWSRDSATLGLLQNVLSEKELKYIQNLEVNGINIVNDIMTRKIINEMNATLSGREGAFVSLDNANEIHRSITKATV